MLTPSLVFAYWMCGSMAGILYASGLSLSRCHSGHQQALAAAHAAIVRLGPTNFECRQPMTCVLLEHWEGDRCDCPRQAGVVRFADPDDIRAFEPLSDFNQRTGYFPAEVFD